MRPKIKSFDYEQSCKNGLRSFYQNLDFLIWFQGKDFAKSLSGFLPEFPMKTYYKFAKTHFDYTQFADLMEIRKLLESYVSAL
jgi:hypothetical protein